MTAPAPLTTPQKVATRLGLGTDEAALADVADETAAVNALLPRWLTMPASGGWTADQQLGALMLATRLYRRRNSPAGVESFGPDGTAYVQRNDPDVAMLLGIGAYAPPVVG